MQNQTIYKTEEGAFLVESWYQKALERLPVPVESCYVETRFGQTHLLATGNPNGQPVLLLHGLNNNAMIWRPQFPALQNYRVYAPDIIGQPGRSALVRPSLAADDYNFWLLDVLDALGLDKTAMVGLSLGGYLTLKFGNFAPERLEKAVLLAPAGLCRVKWDMAVRTLSAMLPFTDHEILYRELLTDLFTTPGVPKAVAVDDAVELLEIVHLHERPFKNFSEVLDSVLPGLPLLDVKHFKVPTLLIIGDSDKLFDGEAVCERAQAALPNLVAAEILPNAGHAMTYEHPQAINERMAAFLDG